MKFTTDRESLVSPLQHIVSAAGRGHTMPILSNILIRDIGGYLSLTSSDLEVEISASTQIMAEQPGEITVPAKKLSDILKALPARASVTFAVDGDRATLRSGKSRFTLGTLPATDFPLADPQSAFRSITVSKVALRHLLETTDFAMAQNDVRYYLNGMCMQVEGDTLRTVSTDGHRLALCESQCLKGSVQAEKLIVPRKAIIEAKRIFDGDGDLTVSFGTNHIRFAADGVELTSKLIDAQYPDYNRVVPESNPLVVKANKNELLSAMQRVSILSSDKYEAVRIRLNTNTMTISASNENAEDAEEQLAVEYDGDDFEIGFNVGYFKDAVAAVGSDVIEMCFRNADSVCLINDPNQGARFVVMPMRL